MNRRGYGDREINYLVDKSGDVLRMDRDGLDL